MKVSSWPWTGVRTGSRRSTRGFASFIRISVPKSSRRATQHARAPCDWGAKPSTPCSVRARRALRPAALRRSSELGIPGSMKTTWAGCCNKAFNTRRKWVGMVARPDRLHRAALRQAAHDHCCQRVLGNGGYSRDQAPVRQSARQLHSSPPCQARLLFLLGQVGARTRRRNLIPDRGEVLPQA